MDYFWFLALSSFFTALTAAISKMTQENMEPRGVSMEVNLFLIVECGVLGSVFLYFVNDATKNKSRIFRRYKRSINLFRHSAYAAKELITLNDNLDVFFKPQY